MIIISTKKGIQYKTPRKTYHSRAVIPLGYQVPVEFYTPKYDTSQAKENKTPDLRTTIHWQPNVRTDDNGMAVFDFYTADSPTTYTVIMEGVASNGSIIHQEGKIVRKVK